MLRSFIVLITTAAVALLIACQPPTEETAGPEASGETLPRIENQQLGLAVGAVPTQWKVVSGEGETIRLEHLDETGAADGELWIETRSPEVGGVNLVNMIKQSQADYEAMEEGVFKGQVELGTQFGNAFSVRGQFNEAGQAYEERQIFSVHPAQRDLALVMVYRYPAPANTRERTEEMLALFSELEDLSFQPGGSEPASGEAAEPAADATGTNG
ncbi:MAG: hypothetical protein SX243_15560 [Acidobacteriota bacterium]|nr:hypothetical protein [Acidobacteriota bacterium]